MHAKAKKIKLTNTHTQKFGECTTFFRRSFFSPANPRGEKNNNHNSDINVEFEVLMVVEDSDGNDDNDDTNTCTH